MEVHALGVLESSTFSYHHLYFTSKIVTKCESQIEASWTALKAWKSGNKVT
uniref:Uncharacterized protein n=1 Tax=Helianthus annuus TaxID=4232 RepID=A0A251RST5_HELAN